MTEQPDEKESKNVPKSVSYLVARFREHREQYRSPTGNYNETQVRREFLDPLFAALGWDVSNEANLSAAYKEVIHEDAIKVQGKTKAPDYCFRVGGVRQFFLEAKKPAVNIRESAPAAYQLRRYAWSAKLPFSILSDFEEFAVYDCRPKPKRTDDAATARILYFTLDELEERWDELSSMFGRDAVSSGALRRFAYDWKPITGGAEVDRAFLSEIESWRDELARDVASNNSDIIQSELNFAVQRIIDRIIFLRICEDRGLEEYCTLLACAQAQDVYRSLLDVFQRADEKYNSGLFHFASEKDWTEPPDRLTPILSISNKPLISIIRKLYFPDSPYEFSVLPAEILGQVYEQFLGKVIYLNEAGRARVEEKPEVRKAGGVYYTPAFVVDYIIQTTIGPALERNEPRTIGGLTDNFRPSKARDAQPLRILDPSCGSGSFLLAAYDHLLRWYLRAYTETDADRHASGKSPKLYAHPSGEWRLTTDEKKRILLTHIYGVDIDPQAVETTKLSLLLKVLEGEVAETIGSNLRLFEERALPDLARNIKCGNSLVDVSESLTESVANWDTEFISRINLFNWRDEFPHVFCQGGFDIVIGNPPYRRERDFKSLLGEISCTEFGRMYRSARMDLWYYFVHKALHLMKPGGRMSYITNAYWLNGAGSEKLINHIKEEGNIEEIVYLDKLKIFSGVAGIHMIMRLKKQLGNRTLVRRVPDKPEGTAEEYLTAAKPFVEFEKERLAIFHNGKIDIEPPRRELLSKIEKGERLSDLGIIRQGIAENPATINKKTNSKYGDYWSVGEGVFAITPEEVRSLGIPSSEAVLLRKYHDLCDIGRYYLASEPSLRLIYSTPTTCPDIDQYPVIYEHLKRFRPIMEARRETRAGTRSWWHLHWPRDEALWKAEKILSVQMGKRPTFAKSVGECYVGFSVNVFVPRDTIKVDINYILGVLNSRLLWLWFKHNAKRRGVGLELNGGVLGRAPIVIPDLGTPGRKRLYEDVVANAKQMSNLVGDLQKTRAPHVRKNIERQIAATDEVVDNKVFEVYGLSQDECTFVRAETQE
jgi:hypothetical protein